MTTDSAPVAETPDQLAAAFEEQRTHLRAVAYRMLGSVHEADDAVQEAWVRLSRTDTADVGNLTGWLTTVVSRVCLDMLRARSARPEDLTEIPDVRTEEAAPEDAALMADALGPALMLVLDALTPGERLAFVLHDLFAVPFPEIATILGTTPAAARQLASRGRRRVQNTEMAERSGQDARTVVEAFLKASKSGDFQALLDLLHPDVTLKADDAAVAMGVSARLSGPHDVATLFNGRAKALLLTTIDGEPGLVWQLHGVPQVVFAFTVEDGRVTGIEQLAGRETIERMSIHR
jgi:RNA polymerase sigma factor (sigma-70 family)